MTRFWSFLLIAFLCCAGSAAQAQSTPASVDCVQQLSGGPCSNWIRNITSFTAGNYLTVGGYYQQGDSGGGLFQAGADGSCLTIHATAASTTAGSYTVVISYTGPVAPAAGMSVTSARSGTSIATFSYDIITNVSGSTITLEIPVVKSLTGVTLTISKDNGGSVIADAESVPGPRCFTRSSSQYTPKEWGAFESGNPLQDDTVAMQSWLNTGQNFITGVNQSHIAVAGPSMQPAAVSIVSLPLTCPAGTTVQGPVNLSNAPLFTIQANGTPGVFPATGALLTAGPYCRLSGIGIDGNGVAQYAVDVEGEHVTIDGFSALLNATAENLHCAPTAGAGALIVKDSYIGGAGTAASGIAPDDGDNIHIEAACGGRPQ